MELDRDACYRVLLARDFKILLQRVDHDVADEANPLARNALGQQVLVCVS